MINPFYRLLLLLLCLQLWTQSAFAGSAEDNAVVSALRQAEKGNWAQAQYLERTSSNPAVKTTLKWYAYTKGVSDGSFDNTAAFINSHMDWPYIDKIRLEAEKHITDNVPDVVVIKWFSKHQPLTSSGMDRYLNALKARGRNDEVKKILREWWAEADLTRDQQKQFFARYNHLMDKDSHKKRMTALLYKGDYANAMAVADVLGADYVLLAKARKGLATNDGAVNSLIAAVPSSLRNDEGLLYERLKWRRKNDLNDGAIEILNQAPRATAMYNPKGWWRERHIIIRRLIEEKQYNKAYLLASGHKQTEGFPLAQAEWVSGWLALRFVNKPWQAFEHFEKLYKNVETPISKSRGAYWSGRASEALKHPEVARQWYEVASRYPETFYGQLAAEKIGAKAVLRNDSAPFISKEQRNQYDRKDLVQAARWLAKAGMKQQTSAMLLRLSKNADHIPDYLYAAELADNLGYKDISIKIAQNLQNDKNIRIGKYLYPQLTDELRNVKHVEWALVNALIRQESRFDQNAVSPAGARGLMQIMPATARGVAAKKGMRHQTEWLTSNPSHNISLGSDYISQMVGKFDGSYAMAAAAYNAGPNRVVRWIDEFGDPRRGQIDLIDWIELIPIYETRNYVQRVLEGVHVYRNTLKGKQSPPVVPIHVAAR